MSPASGKKIVFLGGGSTQFAPLLIADFIKQKDLYGSTIVLVDVNEEKLKLVYGLGQGLIKHCDAALKLEYTTDRVQALPGADFAIVSVEVNRMPLWKMDQRIPKEFGIEQAQGENGGPGGLFHAMRQIPVVVEICQDIERLCPDAMVINLANPMSRILQAVQDYTSVKFLGSCHEIVDGNGYLSALLELPGDRLHVVAAGLNHFTWYLDIRDKETGEDLYPMVRELAPTRVHMDRLLVADLLRLTGYLCVTSDSHAGEYLADGHVWRAAWASDVEPFDFFSAYQLYLKDTDDRVARAVAGSYPLDDFMQWPSGEIVAEIISSFAHDRTDRYNALNLSNDGYISNMSPNAIVEVPGWTNGGQVEGEPVGALPPVIAGWCNLQAEIHHLNAKAAMEGDRQAALEALLLDPVVKDRFAAEKCLDAMLEANRAYLPRFFG